MRPLRNILAAGILPLLAIGAGALIQAAPLRIMPVGDSITAGYTDNSAWTVPFEFGYRRHLYQLLENAGYDFLFVGASPEPFNYLQTGYGDPTHGGTVSPVFDLRTIGQNGHRGYGGIRIPQLNSNIVSYLNADDPDVILLMIGINGMDSGSPAELATLVNDIVTTKPDAHLILAQITPMASNITYAQKNADLVSYNTYIRETLVPTLQSQGKLISTIDQYRNFLSNPNDAGSAINASLYSNGINHPTNPAYDTMAGTWFAGIQAVIPAPATPLLNGNSLHPSIPQGTTIGILTHTAPPVQESFTFDFATGPGDSDNSKFTITGNQLRAGVHDFSNDPPNATYQIRVKATGATSGRVGNETFILNLIPEDSDHDQLPDAWEMAKASNLLDLTFAGDFDHDGLTDTAEYNHSIGSYPGIDPTKSDTDGDGLTDGQEIAGAGQRPATNPTAADTDGDGICDLNEDNSGSYVSILQTGTNPAIANTDGDATGDGAEILQNTNPASALSPAALSVIGTSSTTSETYASSVSTTDLLHGLSGPNSVHTGWYLKNGAVPEMLNNGIHGAALITTPVEGGWSQANGSVSTYTLPPASGNGWDISNITTIADWGGASGFANQRYEVAVRRVWEAGFSTLASVNYQPFTATGIGGSKVQITQPGTKLAVGVAQIRFTMLTTNGNSGRSVYREFDVFGTQSVTPPARILAIAAPAGGGPMTSITWSSHPQKTYKVESSENLQQWSVLDPVFPSGGVTTTFRAFPGPSPDPRAFYRVSANP